MSPRVAGHDTLEATLHHGMVLMVASLRTVSHVRENLGNASAGPEASSAPNETQAALAEGTHRRRRSAWPGSKVAKVSLGAPAAFQVGLRFFGSAASLARAARLDRATRLHGIESTVRVGQRQASRRCGPGMAERYYDRLLELLRCMGTIQWRCCHAPALARHVAHHMLAPGLLRARSLAIALPAFTQLHPRRR